MSNGEQFFRADKANRNTAFSFRNGVGNQDPPETDGDQSARLHPTPAILGTGQKVADGHGESGYESTTLEHTGKEE